MVKQRYGISPEKRLEGLLTYYFDKNYYAQNKKNIIVIGGDLSNKNFNLSEENYKNLQKSIDCIINTASITKHYGSYSAFEKANVESF